MQGKVVRHMTFFGQYAEIFTPSLSYSVHAVQPSITESGYQRGHADVDITLLSAVSGLHGLLGQSYHNIQARECAETIDFSGEGVEDDYVVESVSSVPTAITLQQTSRKLLKSVSEGLPITASISASRT